MRQPDRLPAFCRVHRKGRPLIGIMQNRASGLAVPLHRSTGSARRAVGIRPTGLPTITAVRRAWAKSRADHRKQRCAWTPMPPIADSVLHSRGLAVTRHVLRSPNSVSCAVPPGVSGTDRCGSGQGRGLLDLTQLGSRSWTRGDRIALTCGFVG